MEPVTLTYTRSLLNHAIFYFWWRTVGWKFIAAFALMALSLLIAADMSKPLLWTTYIAMLLTLAFSAGVYVQHVHGAGANLQRMGTPRATLTVMEDAFTMTSGAGSETISWNDVPELWRTPKTWLVFFTRQKFSTLPVADLPPDMQTFILDHVRKAGGTIR